MNNLPRYSIAILAIAAMVLPRILPTEIKQLLSTEQWYALVHIAMGITALIYLWKATFIKPVRQKRINMGMAILLLIIAVIAVFGLLGSLSFLEFIIIYAGWFVLMQSLHSLRPDA